MRILLCLVFSISLYADPVDLEVAFLSSKQISALLEKFDKRFEENSEQFTQTDSVDCIPMGEGCFHPQFGMIPVEGYKKSKSKMKEKPIKVKTINATETSLIDCDKNSYFDIFCGKSRASKVNPKIEVWIDTSTSIRNADYSKDQLYCERRHFVSGLRKTCGDKILFSTFESTVSELGNDQNLCNNVGMNNSERLVEAIKGSSAKYLLVVTDTEEYKEGFREYLDLVGAKLTGIGATTVTAEMLTGIYSTKFQKMCK